MLDKLLTKQSLCLNIICCQMKHVLILPSPRTQQRESRQNLSSLSRFLQGVYLHILQALPEDLTSNFSTHLGAVIRPGEQENVDIFLTFSFWLSIMIKRSCQYLPGRSLLTHLVPQTLWLLPEGWIPQTTPMPISILKVRDNL